MEIDKELSQKDPTIHEAVTFAIDSLLTAQFANGAHQSYGAAMSSTITVTVK